MNSVEQLAFTICKSPVDLELRRRNRPISVDSHGEMCEVKGISAVRISESAAAEDEEEAQHRHQSQRFQRVHEGPQDAIQDREI